MNTDLVEKMNNDSNFGPNHIHTLSTRSTRALIFDDMGRTKEAISLLTELVPLMESKLSQDNPQTIKAKAKLQELREKEN